MGYLWDNFGILFGYFWTTSGILLGILGHGWGWLEMAGTSWRIKWDGLITVLIVSCSRVIAGARNFSANES